MHGQSLIWLGLQILNNQRHRRRVEQPCRSVIAPLPLSIREITSARNDIHRRSVAVQHKADDVPFPIDIVPARLIMQDIDSQNVRRSPDLVNQTTIELDESAENTHTK